MGKDLDWFFITIDVHARYTLTIPAGTKEEAIRDAYNRSILPDKLYDVEKDVVKVLRMTDGNGRIRFTSEKC